MSLESRDPEIGRGLPNASAAVKNEKRDNKQCLLDTPRRVTFNNKRLKSKGKSQRNNVHIYKSHMALLRITKGNYSDNISH